MAGTSKIDKVIMEINKKFGENTIGRIGTMPTLEAERVSSGSPYLDWCIGGGWPLGRTIELYGIFSSGKSLIALRTVAEFQKLGKTVVYLDAENAFSPDFAKHIGIDPDKLIISQISAGEEVFDMIDKLLDTEVSLIVVDSVASLLPDYEAENEMGKQTIGLHARLMSKGLRKITAKAAHNKTLIIFINQIREKPTTYGNPNVTTGGRALGFYASLRIEVSRGEFIEEDKNKIGQQVKFRTTKSKISPPFREGYFIFYYPNMEVNTTQIVFDNSDELVSMLLLQNKIIRRGSYYDVIGKTFQGREELEREIRDNNEFREELNKLWKEPLKEIKVKKEKKSENTESEA
jgi:recombination protein RecA